MFYTPKQIFKDHDYHSWLKERIQNLETAISENMPCDSTDDMELLKRKLASYRQVEADLAKQYGIQNEMDSNR
ncbi:hypothetical protein AUJ26_00120 [Candidatus Falkowbacteria bacterium CG1_02_37_21]|nr:MAG: hypothetical protein AUJ26_00120 [Candidatus Falkowbacteria bacterium CG1_02_37_21]